MISPKNPGVKGNDSVEHDGRPDSSHEYEVKKAGSNNGGSESGHEESGRGTQLDKSND